MSYQALYRKYRSKTFDELVGQEAIVQTLKNALESGKINHAYLFSGPRGTGKTSVARLFAKALNCSEGLGEQCNKCENCLEITEGTHPDVVEIDAASNSGVDEVRELIEKVKYAPIKGRYKVYIIDEVHMMSNSAFNALLKTLEEPPSYVVFILCTTEPYKLLPTIISRCQRYEFSKIEDKDLNKLIHTVLEKEGIRASEDSINLISELASGGARDALSLLDQVIAYSKNNINLDDIEQIFGLVNNEDKYNLLKFLHDSDTINTLNLLNKFIRKNIDFTRLINELLVILKDALVYKITHDEKLIISNNLHLIYSLAEFYQPSEILKLMDLFLECQKEFKVSANVNFIFEVYLLKSLSIFNENKSESTSINLKETSDYIYKDNSKNSLNIVKETKVEETKPIINEEKIEEKKIQTEEPLLFDPSEEILSMEREKIAQSKKQENNEIKEEISSSINTIKEENLEVKKDEKPANLEKNPAEPASKLKILKYIGKANYINDDNLIKLLVLAKKEPRRTLVEQWNNLTSYVNDKQMGNAARLLVDCSIFAVTDRHVILASNYPKDSKIINYKDNQLLFSNLIKEISGKDYFIYSLERSRYTEIRKRYTNLNQLKRLPVVLDLDEIEIDTEVNEE